MFVSRLLKHWYGEKPCGCLTVLLVPLSWLYRCIIWLRKQLYRFAILKSYRLDVPVIVVGNITVGGTGKSPLTVAIAHQLQQAGYRPGLISRGYGGQSKTWPQWVTADSNPELVGDEPVMLVQQTGCPMVVGPDRVQAARTLLKQADCNVIISDDGLQHTPLMRDLEIAVVDGERRYGNGQCLPAGPLREPFSRLNTVDAEVCQGQAQANEYAMTLSLAKPINMSSQKTAQSWSDFKTPVHAVAGIGHPERFFKALEQKGLTVIRHPFPDHHDYVKSDLEFDDNYPILMTAKDAVKCLAFSMTNGWCVPVTADCDTAFWEWLLGCQALSLQ